MRDELAPDRCSWAWIALGLLLLLLGLAVLGGLRVDDAYISYRFAGNAASGAGLVFNPGERTEGYTNFLWTAILAAGAALGVAPEVAAPALGRTCLALTLLVAWRTMHRVGALAGPGWRGLALLLTLTSTTLAYWASAGLETPLFALLWLASRERLAAAWHGSSTAPATLLLVLLVLCRPDGALGVVSAFAVWLLSGSGEERRRARASLAAVASGLAAYAAWKLAYYGALLPNTFHVRWDPGAESLALGARQALSFSLAHPWLACAALGVVGRRRLRGEATGGSARDAGSRRLELLLGADVAVFAAYAVAIGGDPMPYQRFFAVLVAPLALLAALPLARRFSAAPLRARRVAQTAPAALAVAGFLGSLTGASLDSALLAHRVVEVGGVVGAHLRATLPPGSLVAVNAAGAIPYVSGLPTVDMLGLTDAHVARSRPPREAGGVRRGHERGDGAYVLARRPAVVVLGTSAGSFTPVFASDRDLLRQPGFARLYVPVEIPLGALARRYGLPGATTRRVRRPAPVPWAGERLLREERLGVLLRTARGTLWPVRETWSVDTTLRYWLRRDLSPLAAPEAEGPRQPGG